MHIVSILTSLTSGGAEMLVVNLSKEYVAKGHRSTIVTLADATSVGNSAEMEATLRQRIRDEGGEVVSLNLGTSRNPLKGWWQMRRLMQSLRPDVIHAHTARALLMLYPAPGGAPVVLTHHNSHLSFHPRMFELFDRIVRAYVAISKETEAIFARYVCRPIAYIPNAASKSFAAKAPRAAPGTARQILSVGTISAQKHYDLLVDTAAEMKTRLPATEMPKFLIAGNGVELEAMRALTREKGVADHVSFLGERSDIAELMATSDIYLNTSRYEGMPVALLEAMASGLPIVATRVAGNTELIGHEENGLLCPLDEPSALSDAIIRLFSDSLFYAACSKGAIRNAGTFSIDATTDKHIALFQRLVASQKP
jgi:glycosyltransferase involved in cell wall biosynthesis